MAHIVDREAVEGVKITVYVTAEDIVALSRGEPIKIERDVDDEWSKTACVTLVPSD